MTFALQPERSQSSGSGNRERSLVRERARAFEKKPCNMDREGEEGNSRGESVASSHRDEEDSDTAEIEGAEDREARSAASGMSKEASFGD